MAIMSKKAGVIILMVCLLLTPGCALDIFFLISRLGAAVRSVQIIFPKSEL